MANKVNDITGKKFGKLTVIGRDGYTGGKRKYILWKCKCDCGNEVLRTSSHLKQVGCPSCGKCRLIKEEDYVGKKFGYWTVIAPAKGTSRKKAFLCRCKCGNEKIVNADTLKLGNSKSCGCYHVEEMKRRQTTHGQTGTRIFCIYHNIKSRCYDKNNKRYPDYGGRGIQMCEEWLNNSSSFFEWSFSNGYSDSLTIDRIDNNGNYEPSNCRWITNAEQLNNRRNNIKFIFFGVTKTLKEWCDCIGESYDKLYGRYYRGYETFRKGDIEKIKKFLENGGEKHGL